jgi:catechol 2,3-dioxygenase-like lactoylglutathione lyase family enzyme
MAKATGKEPAMSLRLGRPSTEADPAMSAIVVVTCILTAVGVLLLIRAQFDGNPRHVTVRVDNQTRIPLQIDAKDAAGSTVGLGEAGPQSVTSFVEVPDIGQRWMFVAAYGGREVYREQLLRAELVADGWTVRIPAAATAALERAGFR